MHPHLERQWRKFFGNAPIPAELRPFVDAVSLSYESADATQNMAAQTLRVMSEELTERNEVLARERDEQKALVRRLEEAHNQLLQSEKMASIGQLAAGVAHEINNPIGYVNSNLGSLQDCMDDLLKVIDLAQAARAGMRESDAQAFDAVCAEVDLPFLREDLPEMIGQSREGIDRVRRIVQDLKDFSHADEGVFAWSDLHQGIRSTLNIVANELKYKADVQCEFADLPLVECIQGQLNQVFMNLLVNAAHAIPGERRGQIAIRTRTCGDGVILEFSDDGVGIPQENLNRIFDPFFTTKPVGKGTGLGLSLSYGIVQKHHGRIEVDSTLGQGSTFRIFLPLSQPVAASSG